MKYLFSMLLIGSAMFVSAQFAQSEGYLDFTVSGDYTIEQLFNTLK